MPTHRLTKHVKVKRRVTPENGFEVVDTDGDDVVSAWADLRPMTAFERVSAEQVYAGSTHRAIIRWPGVDVKPGDYLVANGERYDIQGVVDLDGNAQYLELTLTKDQTGVGSKTTR